MGIRRPIKNDLIWLLVDAIPVFGDKINSFMYYVPLKTSRYKKEENLKISNERYTYVKRAMKRH
jgi:hypothetical protein